MSFYQRITRYLPLPLWHIVGLFGLVLGLVWIVIAYHAEGGEAISEKISSLNGVEQNQQPIELLAMSPAAEKKWMEIVAPVESTPTINLPPASSLAITATVNNSVPEISKENVSPLISSLPELKKTEIKKLAEEVEPVTKIKSPENELNETPKKTQERYTLQLLSSQNQASIQTLLDKNSSVKQLRMMTIQQKGQERYLLIYGNFSSRDEASSAIAHIPAQVIQGSPWIRSLGAAHEKK